MTQVEQILDILDTIGIIQVIELLLACVILGGILLIRQDLGILKRELRRMRGIYD